MNKQQFLNALAEALKSFPGKNVTGRCLTMMN